MNKIIPIYIEEFEEEVDLLNGLNEECLLIEKSYPTQFNENKNTLQIKNHAQRFFNKFWKSEWKKEKRKKKRVY